VSDSGEKDLLLQLLRRGDDLEFLAHWLPAQWELLLRQARHANLLSRLAVLLEDRGMLDAAPQRCRRHLEGALLAARAHRRSCLWETRLIHRTLRGAGIDLCLLKGSAYAWLGNNASRGRLFGDIDILVRREQLAAAEETLAKDRWVTTKLDSYSQDYYRRWMHEIPPLHHVERHSNLDVHHTVVPPIARSGFDVRHFWDAAQEAGELPGLYVLAPADRILHSAAHLFQEGEFDNGCRDLVDLDALLREYAAENGGWDALLSRAQQLDLSVHLHYALGLCAGILHTPVPRDILTAAAAAAGQSRPRQALMYGHYSRALRPYHRSCRAALARPSRWLLYLRSHYIRMPLRVLLPHLYRKAFLDE